MDDERLTQKCHNIYLLFFFFFFGCLGVGIDFGGHRGKSDRDRVIDYAAVLSLDESVLSRTNSRRTNRIKPLV